MFSSKVVPAPRTDLSGFTTWISSVEEASVSEGAMEERVVRGETPREAVPRHQHRVVGQRSPALQPRDLLPVGPGMLYV